MLLDRIAAAAVVFLWQGALIGIALWMALQVVRGARLRHAMAVAALVAMLGWFGIDVLADGEGLGAKAQIEWLGQVWMVGAVGVGLWRVSGWWMTRRLVWRGVTTVAPEWRERFERLRERMGVLERVEWFESALVDVPVMVGWWRPVVLTPVGMLVAMPVEQVEALLLHELAHVARWDALVNLLKAVAESLLFFHPAVWWVSRVVRVEREKCCDDLVVAVSGDRVSYAKALVEMEEQRSYEMRLAANGGELTKRVARLLGKDEPSRGWGAVMAIALACCVLVAGAQQMEEVYKKWVEEDVVYIIGEREKNAFLALRTAEEREKFIEQFWTRRDPKPETEVNEAKVEHYRRILYANERFRSTKSGWKTDRGKLYIVNGPPDEIEVHPVKRESWLYRSPRKVFEFEAVDGEMVLKK